MRRWFARSVAVVALAQSVAGCTKVATSPGTDAGHAYTHPHQFRFASASDIQQLNPLIEESLYEAYLGSMTMAWFIKTDAHGDATVPELITEIPSQKNGGISADGKRITWHLRRGVKWSDGAPFDADDVVFTTKQVLNPLNNVISTDGWDLISHVEEPDKFTVIYDLKKPYSSFAVTFFSTGGANPAVLPQHLLKHYRNLNQIPYNSAPVGIGPFKYQAWHRGDSVTMVANDLYFRGRPKLNRITYSTVQDRNTVLEQLRTHELDAWIPIPAHYYPQVRDIPGVTVVTIPSYQFNHLDFNLNNPVLQDVRVRQALRLGIDRKQIIDKIQDGLYILNESPVVPINKYHLDEPLVPFDLVKANTLLDAAGWKRGPDGIRTKGGRRLSLIYSAFSGSPDVDTQIELIRSSWKQLGVEFTVKRYLASQFFAPAAQGGIIYGGKFDVVGFGWSSDPNEDISNEYACYRFPPNGQNVMHWCDSTATAAMDAAKASYDVAARKKYISIVQRRLYAGAPTIILSSTRQIIGYNSDLRNWHPNPIAPFDDMMKVDI